MNKEWYEKRKKIFFVRKNNKRINILKGDTSNPQKTKQSKKK